MEKPEVNNFEMMKVCKRKSMGNVETNGRSR